MCRKALHKDRENRPYETRYAMACHAGQKVAGQETSAECAKNPVSGAGQGTVQPRYARMVGLLQG